MEFNWSSDGREKRVFATYQLHQEQGAEGAGQGAELHLQYKMTSHETHMKKLSGEL